MTRTKHYYYYYELKGFIGRLTYIIKIKQDQTKNRKCNYYYYYYYYCYYYYYFYHHHHHHHHHYCYYHSCFCNSCHSSFFV